MMATRGGPIFRNTNSLENVDVSLREIRLRSVSSVKGAFHVDCIPDDMVLQ